MAMIACFLPMQLIRYRASARSASCSNNLKQIGLAIYNYNSAYARLPTGSGGSSSGDGGNLTVGNADRLSGLVGILPFLGEQKLWQEISTPWTGNDQTFPALGPAP
ncbi:protein containing DUF1559 [Rhodopirellula sp. SWK7]|nr:protein containing DUF1559 [Rhodopirellula sp. SWK7]